MITQWDIISSISPQSNAILYALLIDGTEHDARLIAKKLQGYAQPPQPALAPYVYRFALPEDLDEDTLEKIRQAVREGIEQAKKVNEFVPGGALGNPLFQEEAAREDKAFPTFITLDPSESFFRTPQANQPKEPLPPQPPVEAFEQHQIDLSAPDEEPHPVDLGLSPFPPKQDPLQDLDKEGYRSDPPTPLPEELPAPEEELTSVEAEEENWPDTPPESEREKTAPPVTDIRVKGVVAPDLSTQLRKQAAEQVQLPPQPQPQEEALPLTDQDMLNKDMEGTLLDPALDDIFSAETKYDMFVDLDKLAPAQKQANAPKSPAPVPPAQPAESPKPQAAQKDPAAAEQAEGGFNIFDQKIKDQTCFVDLDDVENITERITQKDFGFVQHAQVKKADEKPAPAEPTEGLPLPPQFERFNPQAEEPQEVMDPFEQLLASADKAQATPQPEPEAPAGVQPAPEKAAEEPASLPEPEPEPVDKPLPEPEAAAEPPAGPENVVPKEPLQEPAPQAPIVLQTVEPTSLPAPQEEQLPSVEEELPSAAVALPSCAPQAPAAAKPQDPGNVSAPQAPQREKTMPENTGDKKTFFRLKRKVHGESPAPAAPHAPLPPAAPHAPQAPAPHTPAPAPLPQQPAPAPAVQEEKHGATILRRRRPQPSANLEKTHTIDHSIELPLSELKKHNWPLEVPLIPTYTLENMTISVNRFAHATAISVIDNPGKLYNPLVLHGGSGTGKTHFLHAIGYALSKKYGQENIFITNGVRLSRGIQRYVMEGNMDKFEQFVSTAKALLIDDIHLIAINEQNRAHLSKLLNDFLQQHKQIVITSKYPPESLEKLEELLNFRLDSGWISELKPASGPARKRIISKMLLANNIDITDADIDRFFGQPNMSLGTVSRSIRRVRVLEKMIFPNEPASKRSATAIFDQLLATAGEDQKSLIASKIPDEVTSAPVAGNGEWGRIGFFYPQNHSNMMNWLVFALQQRAKELGIPGGPELAVRSSYATENVISSAFKIANLCDNKKLKGAVILGPEMESCDPSVRENFYDILTHMLEIMLIRCGVINYEDVNKPSTYVKILSELLR